MIDFELVKRFVSDEKLPIQVIKKEEYFNYMLDLFEDGFQSRTKWLSWQKVIESEYNGDSKKYLADFYKIRDKIIADMKGNEKYAEFNTCDMNKYRIQNMPQIGATDIYKTPNRGKYYLSIDLKKANFQALKYVGVIEEPTYEVWLSKWTKLPHLLASKYLRVVVFGQLNPGRHITVEKYISAKIHNHLCDVWAIDDWLTFVSFKNDELIWEVQEEQLDVISGLIKDFENSIKYCGFEVSIELFKLHCFELLQEESGHSLFFYKKEYFNGGNTYHCIPGTYQAIVTRLLQGNSGEEEVELCDYDTWFEHDGMLSQFIGKFKIEKL